MKYLSIILICILSLQLEGQSVEFKKSNFQNKPGEYKIAKKEFKKGNKMFKKGKGKYPEALKHYAVAHKFNSKSAILNYRMGICLLEGMFDTNALTHIQTAINLDASIYRHSSIKKMERNGSGVYHYHYLLGRAYHINKMWDKSIVAFKVYKQSLSKYDAKYFGPKVDKQIRECEAGKKMTSDPSRVRIQNVGKIVNSPNSDYGSLLSHNDSMMIYTSRRKGAEGEKGQNKNKIAKHDNQYFEKIYMAHLKDDQWVSAEAFPKPVNRHKRHQATAGISNDGNTLYLYVTHDRKKGGSIYASEFKEGKWKKPKKFKKVHSKYDETSIAFSKDNKYMFFVSNRHRNSQGGRDIWYCYAKKTKKDSSIKWSRPRNLGENVNTKYDEDYPFMHHDNTTLYFSSKGHNSIGGYDIMKSDLIERGVFSRPKNLSVPVNTPRDDLGFALRKDERLAYFTSTRNEGVGEKDIYVIKYLGKEKEVELDFETYDIFNNIEVEKQIEPELEAPADEVVVISGTITSDKTLEPISAEVLVIDPDSKKILAKMDNHSVTGNYQVTVMSNVAYKIKAKSIGYENESKKVTVGAFADQQEYDVDLVLKTENKEENTTETILILDKLYFEYKSSVLMEESYPQLNRVARLMVENEKWEVEVGGHTDNIGNVNYNIGLSGDRAKSVVDYLVSRGVPLKRLWWKGYGSVKPISNNTTERGRAKNRRVEFKILKN